MCLFALYWPLRCKAPFALQSIKYPSKSHLGSDHRHEKMRDGSDPAPPYKMLRRSDSPENRQGDPLGHSKAKATHQHRLRERDGGKDSAPRLVSDCMHPLDQLHKWC